MDTFVWDAWWPGGTVLAVLAALFLWVRSRTKDPGFLAFALAFMVGALIYLVKNPLLRDFGGTSAIGLAMAGLAAVLMATGMCLYTHPEKAPLRKAVRLAAGWTVVVFVLHAIDVAEPLTAHVSLSVLILFLANPAWVSAFSLRPFWCSLSWWRWDGSTTSRRCGSGFGPGCPSVSRG